MAAEVQPSCWLRGQVLLLPAVPRRGLHGVETVLPSGPFEQVTPLPTVCCGGQRSPLFSLPPPPNPPKGTERVCARVECVLLQASDVHNCPQGHLRSKSPLKIIKILILKLVDLS